MASSLLLLALVAPALSAVVPTGPSPGQVFNEGSQCEIDWNVDTSGVWTKMEVQLMTGSNNDMIPLATILSDYDGTKSPGSYSYDCPDVDPNSAIYFYQFTNGGDMSTVTWTGRFAIADQSGNTTPPPNTQGNVSWGVGKLTGSSVSLSSAGSGAASSESGSPPSSATSGASNGTFTTGTSPIAVANATSTAGSGSGDSSATASRGASTQVVTSAGGSSSSGGSSSGGSSGSSTTDDTSGAERMGMAGVVAAAGLAALGMLAL